MLYVFIYYATIPSSEMTIKILSYYEVNIISNIQAKHHDQWKKLSSRALTWCLSSSKPTLAIMSCPFMQHCVYSIQSPKRISFAWHAFRETKIVCYGIHKNEQTHPGCILSVSSWVNVQPYVQQSFWENKYIDCLCSLCYFKYLNQFLTVSHLYCTLHQ